MSFYKLFLQTLNNMEVLKTLIEGVVIIEPRLFKDGRGCFFESFNQKEFEEKVCKTTFVQDNESKSSYGVIRGLHFQKTPFAQSKLVRVVKDHFFTQNGKTMSKTSWNKKLTIIIFC